MALLLASECFLGESRDCRIGAATVFRLGSDRYLADVEVCEGIRAWFGPHQ